MSRTRHPAPARVPQTEGFSATSRGEYGFSDDEVSRLRYRAVVEPLLERERRRTLQRRAQDRDLDALAILYEQYFRLRFPLIEASLTDEERRRLPWLRNEAGRADSVLRSAYPARR